MNVLVKVWVTDRVGLRSVDSPGFQLGAERPLWVPDEEVAYCHICKAPFTTFRRRVSSFTTVSQLCPNVIAASLPSLWPHLLQSMFLVYGSSMCVPCHQPAPLPCIPEEPSLSCGCSGCVDVRITNVCSRACTPIPSTCRLRKLHFV